jgi:regulator of ribonuclease activity A
MMFRVLTADLLDANEALIATGELTVMSPGLLSLGRRASFAGPCVTVKVFEDNGLIAEAVAGAGEGRVLVVDGGASRRCALVGGRLADEAARNGWAGIVVDGCVRDADEIDQCEIGVRALALHPRRPAKRSAGARDVLVSVAGTVVRPGYWIYADRDGVLVSMQALPNAS